MLKYLLTILLVFLFSVSYCQQKIVKYFDTAWKSVSKEKASFYTEFEKDGLNYKCTSFYYPSMKLYGKSTFADTLFIKGIGYMTRFYESGHLLDSSLFNKDGIFIWTKRFRENGKIELIKLADTSVLGGLVSRLIQYDEKGKSDTVYIVVQIPAQFKGGITGWTQFLQENLRSNVPVRKKAPPGKYTVYVTFTVDKEGNVSDIKAENDPGYGTKEEAIRVISKSPKWLPATQNGRTVNYRHKQGITFQVTEEK